MMRGGQIVSTLFFKWLFIQEKIGCKFLDFSHLIMNYKTVSVFQSIYYLLSTHILNNFSSNFSLTFSLGVSGNILIILTVMKKSSFKSPTNTFLASLATADLLLIMVCLPVKVQCFMRFEKDIHKIIGGLKLEISKYPLIPLKATLRSYNTYDIAVGNMWNHFFDIKGFFSRRIPCPLLTPLSMYIQTRFI